MLRGHSGLVSLQPWPSPGPSCCRHPVLQALRGQWCPDPTHLPTSLISPVPRGLLSAAQELCTSPGPGNPGNFTIQGAITTTSLMKSEPQPWRGVPSKFVLPRMFPVSLRHPLEFSLHLYRSSFQSLVSPHITHCPVHIIVQFMPPDWALTDTPIQRAVFALVATKIRRAVPALKELLSRGRERERLGSYSPKYS